MKNRLMLAAVACLVIFTVSSCEQDGVYNPDRKISKIYTKSYEGEKRLDQTWTWNGNLLSSIDYGWDDITRFEYDKKRVTKIIEDDETYVTFAYNGNKLAKIEEYYYSFLMASTVVEHNGSKIGKLITTFYDIEEEPYESPMSRRSKLLGLLVPEFQLMDFENTAGHQQLIAHAKQAKGLVEIVLELSLTWGGKNIKQIDMEESFYGETYNTTAVYTHDNKKNPLCKFPGLGTLTFSVNNVTNITSSDSEGTRQQNFRYVYDGNFPSTMTEIYGTDDDNINTTITYYEYK